MVPCSLSWFTHSLSLSNPPYDGDSQFLSHSWFKRLSSLPTPRCSDCPLSLPPQVADLNMATRGRVVWAQMWRVLSAHFAAIGAATSRGVTSEVALYAVDSLRQLSVKFLAKDEKARRRALELDVSKRFLFSLSSSSRLLHTSSRCLRLYCVASRDRGADGRCACVGVARPPCASRRLSVAFRFFCRRARCVEPEELHL